MLENAKPKSKTYYLWDEGSGGLYYEITPSGGKWGRIKIRIGGKENRISVGVFPKVSLKEARTKVAEIKTLLSQNIDPSLQRKAMKQTKSGADTFQVIALEWHAKHVHLWTESHANKILRSFERDVFPWIGKKQIIELDTPDLLSVLERVRSRGALDTAHRILTNCNRIFRFAKQTARIKYNPCGDLKGALPPVKGKHFAAITEPQKVGEFLRMIDGYQNGSWVVHCAMRLAPLVFVRPGELRKMEWKDVDFDKAEWRFFVTKTKTPHIVPLSTQAISILKDIYPLTGFGRYVFPCAFSSSKRPMSDNAILAAFRRMGIPKEEMTGHGFRAMARTILDEVLKFRPEIIEQQLAHVVKDPNGRAYNRTAHLDERKRMMQEWASWLDSKKKIFTATGVNSNLCFIKFKGRLSQNSHWKRYGKNGEKFRNDWLNLGGNALRI